MSQPIPEEVIAEARRQKLLESLPSTHRDLGATLDPVALQDFASKVNTPIRLPATPDEIRANIAKPGWWEKNKDRMGFE